MADKNQVKLSILDMQGLFCGVLYRELQNGILTKKFVGDMQRRGFVIDSKERKALEQEINYMIHGNQDFFAFCSSLMDMQGSMNDYAKVVQQLERESKAMAASDDE